MKAQESSDYRLPDPAGGVIGPRDWAAISFATG